MNFVINTDKMCNLICNGGLANESLFAIILTYYKKIQNVVCKTTHMADWFRMSSATSPHIFKEGNDKDIEFIESFIQKNDLVMFIRKVHPEFPDEILRKYIYEDKIITLQKKYIYNSNIFVNIKRSVFINIGIIYGLALIYAFYLFHLTSPSVTTR
jgi:hypothetical protein